MQDERSHNFQRLIVRVSQSANSQHQIIFGTSMLAPDLDIPTLTVGHYSVPIRLTQTPPGVVFVSEQNLRDAS
jgi:hypothetical protein